MQPARILCGDCRHPLGGHNATGDWGCRQHINDEGRICPCRHSLGRAPVVIVQADGDDALRELLRAQLKAAYESR